MPSSPAPQLLQRLQKVDNETDVSFHALLIGFILREYVQSFQDGEFYLFYQDSRKLRLSGLGHLGENLDHTQITTSADTCGFQQIVALSHSSLDNILSEYHLENKCSWMQLFHKDDFEIRFGPPQLRLLSHKCALIFFHLNSGKLRTEKSVTRYIAPNMLTYIREHRNGVHQLENWKLASR